MNKIIYPDYNLDLNSLHSLPSSKSVLHRLLIIACFLSKKTTLKNVTLNQDVSATISCLEHLGATFNFISNDKELEIDATNFLNIIDNHFFVDESGTTLRLLLPILASFNKKIIINTKGNLINRPLSIYEELYKNHLSKDILKNEIMIDQDLNQNNLEVMGNISSQFISGLLLYLSLIKKKGCLKVIKPAQSIFYINLTIDILNKFGVLIDKTEDGHNIFYKIKEVPTKKLNEFNYFVDTDFSTVANFIALGSIYKDIKLYDIKNNFYQPDYKLIDILNNLGGDIKFKGHYLEIKKSKLVPGVIDIENCPDLGSILIVLFSRVKGITKLINTLRLQYKESNRGLVMKQELEKIGIKIEVNENDIVIYGNDGKLNCGIFDSHHDHRIAMALSILSLTLNKESTIKNAECVNKSYPNFYEDLEKLGIIIK